MINKNDKQCKVCNKVKLKENNFRIVNSLNGYTSKTCLACENQATKKPLKRICLGGFLYVLFDEAYPEYVKIGCTSNKPSTRLKAYNSTRPINTCKYIYISKYLENILVLEDKVLQKIYRHAYCGADRKEWFLIKDKKLLISEIKNIESID